MKLEIKDVKEEDRGIVSPRGIVCLGCDGHKDESYEALKKVVDIWEGINLPDVSIQMYPLGWDSHLRK